MKRDKRPIEQGIKDLIFFRTFYIGKRKCKLSLAMCQCLFESLR